MNHKYSFIKQTFKVFTMACLGFYTHTSIAQDQCSAVGWATYQGTVTGGGEVSPVVVSNYADLKTALTSATTKVVHIQGTIAIPSGGRITIQNQNDKSVIGLAGSKLTSADQGASTSGILYLKTSNNIILKNISFVGPGSKDVDGYDNLTIEGGERIWIDHCDFIDGLDGNFDIKRQANYIAVTWCKFSYTSKSSNHQFSNLIGHDDKFTADKGYLKITFQYNWWASGCVERMPRVRFGQVHVVNNYFNSSAADYNIAAGVGSDIRVENNVFDVKTTYVDLSKANSDTKVTSLGNIPEVTTSKGTAFTPPYTLRKSEASAVKALVTDASCGAGATLKTTGCNCVLVTGINDAQTTEQSFYIYPNPSKESFYFNSPAESIVKVFNNSGLQVDGFEAIGEVSFGEAYKPGMYLLQVITPSGIKTLKINKE